MTTEDRSSSLRSSARNVLSNKLTIGFIALSIAYWIATPFLPLEWRDVGLLTVRAGITAGLALTAAAYFESALRSLARGDDGSVTQWLVGIVMMCTSFASSSIYSMAWIWAGRPDWMTNHPMLGFILVWQLVGVSLLIKAPDADRPGISLFKARWFIALAFVAAIIVAFTAGRATTKAQADMNPLHANVSNCPIMGNVRRDGERIYHDQTSPYRAMVHPEACFDTVEEARVAGYRPPR